MFPFTICATFLFLFVLFYWLLHRTNNDVSSKKPPPEAGGAWPLIGHLHLFTGSQQPHATLGKLADKYGPIFTIHLGVHSTLVVSSWEMAKQCFTVNDKAFASRPKSIAFEILGYDSLMIGFSPYGSYWRTVRKISTVHVLSSQRIETMLKHVMESEVKTAMKQSYLLMTKDDNSKRATTEMKKWFGDIAVNVMMRTVVGKHFDGDEEENEKIKKALRDFFTLAGSFVICDTLPYLRWFDLDGKEKEMKKVAKELDVFVSNWLDQHKKHSNKNSGEQDDFMDVFLSTVDDHDLDGHDTDTTVKATCLALILAGTDTTSGTLTWALSLLLNHREVLNKVIQELDAHIGPKKMAIESDMTKLKYLNAVIKETLRLHPPGSLSVPHESIEDCTIGGYHVPAGTRLLTNIWKLQRDPMLYTDPLEFRPERFLESHKDIDVKGHHFELIPFGAGRRMCPGISFALQLIQITLATLLHGFDIVTPIKGPVDMVERSGLTTLKATPLQVILTPRLSTQIFSEN